jgi:chemotaxis protein MotB
VNGPDERGHNEIIIVRRGGGDDEEGHHGGAWKIAFADFMTAMMCFFLVMWLINAANEQTKAAVASYFNPVKLIDRNSSRKGLEDIGDGPNAVGSEAENPQAPDSKAGTFGRANAGPEKQRSSEDAVKEVNYSDEHLFADPYAVLAEIVADTGEKANISAKGDGGASDAGPATGASGGASYRDPFAPDFYTSVEDHPPTDPVFGAPPPKPEQTVAEVVEAEDPVEAMIQAAEDSSRKVEEVIAVVRDGTKSEEQVDVKLADKGKPSDVKSGEIGIKTEQPTADAPKPAETTTPEGAEAKAEPAAEKPQDHGPSAEAIAEAKEIQHELAEAFGKTGDQLDDGISVVPAEGGVTISVTEDFDFGMFEVGSAVPQRELILAMEKIAKVISARQGSVTINGHTDARPFKGGNYDNWRLSTARAHAAYYMLARAGLDEQRMLEVAGFADRKLKNKDDPFAAANRRIEIFLKVGAD